MEVLNLKQGMKIKQRMVHRNLESWGCECRAVQEAQSMGGTGEEQCLDGGGGETNESGGMHRHEGRRDISSQHVPLCHLLVSELSALCHQLQQD